MITPERVVELLNLEPLPHEGGAFRETYRASGTIPPAALARHGSESARAYSTQIYYMIRAGETSALHRVRSDEVFHHYLGDPVLQLRIADGTRTHVPPPDVRPREPASELVLIGGDLESGARPQVVAPADVWQGAVLAEAEHGFALLGCSVAPGFDWEDFELITPAYAAALGEALPEHANLIETLTPAAGRTRA
jgi:hypothetical protein